MQSKQSSRKRVWYFSTKMENILQTNGSICKKCYFDSQNLLHPP
nr:unnamed protein product [Callosobruchus chinensis]CAH7717216.1 unnamed protein product [Callosobruchus chinensis]CAH7752497.1 unnamed protein product [Callosobruchus chinensis]